MSNAVLSGSGGGSFDGPGDNDWGDGDHGGEGGNDRPNDLERRVADALLRIDDCDDLASLLIRWAQFNADQRAKVLQYADSLCGNA